MSSLRTIFQAAALAVAIPGAAAAAVSVHIDEISPVALGGAAAQVFVGNPSIADVSLTDRRHIMILGRTYGVTNVIALDAVGRKIFETTVNVGPSSSGRVTMFRGTDVHNYACSERCERTPMPGEQVGPFKQYDTPYTDYINKAKGSAGGGNQ